MTHEKDGVPVTSQRLGEAECLCHGWGKSGCGAHAFNQAVPLPLCPSLHTLGRASPRKLTAAFEERMRSFPLSHLILTTPWSRRNGQAERPRSTFEKPKAQRADVVLPGLHSWFTAFCSGKKTGFQSYVGEWGEEWG